MPEAVVGSVPFKEAIDHFKDKGLIVTRRWDDLVRGEHSRAFTVAGVTKIEMLNDFKKSIEEIRARGGTDADFRKEFDSIVKRYGWKYNGERNARARIIFGTNIRTANASGRWSQIERRQAALKKRDPEATLYLKYTVLDHNLARRRAEHQSWDGMIHPVDHPIWESHYPPNDWECKCSVRILSKEMIEHQGLKVSESAPELNRTERINRSTSEIYPPTPQGIGVGFDHNHGRSAYLPSGANIVDSRLGSKLSQVSVDSDDFESFIKGKFDGRATVGFLPDGLPEQVGAKTNRVQLSGETIQKQLKRHPDLTVAAYRNLPKIFEEGLIIKDSSKTLVFILVGDKVYRAVIKATNDGKEIFATSLTRSSLKEITRMRKRGEVIREPI